MRYTITRDSYYWSDQRPVLDPFTGKPKVFESKEAAESYARLSFPNLHTQFKPFRGDS